MTKATQTNVDPDKLAQGKQKLEDGVAAYKAASDKMAAASAKWRACAGDDGVDGGLPGRADKGKEATSKLGDSTHKSTAKDADAVDAAHKKYTPQDEDQHQNISKTGDSVGHTDAAVSSEPHGHGSGAGYQRPAQAQAAGPGSGSGGSASSGGGGASGAGFQIPDVSLPQGGGGLPVPQIPDVSLPQGGGGLPVPQVPDVPLPQNQDKHKDEHDGDSQQ